MLSSHTKSAISPHSQSLVAADVERLLKRLVDRVNAAVSLEELQESKLKDGIVFESCIDGIHYQLVRHYSKEDRQVNLSSRELAIARLIAQGLPNKCIARKLNISSHTVSTHLRRIFVKLNVTSRTAMVAQLMKENLL